MSDVIGAPDAEYWLGREKTERARAERTADRAIARIHRQLADQCRDRAGVGERKPRLHLVAN